MQKTYHSFKEIDDDLKILKLKKEIAIWTMKNESDRLQNSLAPKNIALGLLNSFTAPGSNLSWQKTFRNIAIAYILKRILKR